MKIKKLQNIKMCGMIANSELDDKGKVTYEVKTTANFKINNYVTDNFDDKNIHVLLNAIYTDVLTETNTIDSLGIWITYDDHVFENAIKIETLNDMEKLGSDDIQPIYEFCKMTIMDNIK